MRPFLRFCASCAFLRPSLLVLFAAFAGHLAAQPAPVLADPTTGALYRPGAATFASYNNLLTLDGAAGSYLLISTAASTYLPITVAANYYQPLDADLTSWAAVVRAGGFDTFVATPSGANLGTLLTTALPATKGGTGLTAVGTSGNVLTSNGTTWVSSAPTGGVTSITGTAGQIAASTGTGAVTLSIPTAVANVNSLTASSATDLTLTGGSTGASLVLGTGPTNASATLTALGSSDMTFTASTGSLTLNSARTAASGPSFLLNSTSTNGPMFQWRKSGSAVGNIGASGSYLGSTATDFLIEAQTNLVFYTNFSGTEAARFNTAGALVINTSTASTSTTTGSFQTLGGAGIAGNVISGGVVRTAAYTVATLPSAATYPGAIAYVTDSNATTRLATVAAGGSNKVMVYSDGTNWLIL